MKTKIALRKQAVALYLQGRKKSEIARQLKRSRPWVDRWIDRYRAEAPRLSLQDRSRAPKQRRCAYPERIKGMVVQIRQAREQGQRAVCMGTLKQLTLCWIMYADANDDKLVNGEAGFSPNATTHPREIAWVGRCWREPYNSPTGTQWAIEGANGQKANIMNGSMWGYTQNLGMYSCPTGIRGEMLTYNLMDGVNGMPRAGTHTNGVAWREIDAGIGASVTDHHLAEHAPEFLRFPRLARAFGVEEACAKFLLGRQKTWLQQRDQVVKLLE